MPNWLKIVIQVVVGLALPLALLLGNVQLVTHMRFVHYEYGKADFPDDTQIPFGGYPLSTAERTALAEVALDSVAGSGGMRVLEEARFQETGEPAFNAREVGHMRDVRVIFGRARIVFWTALVALVGGVLLLGRRGGHLVTQPVLVSVIATLAVAAALGVYILSNFDSFFTKFHHIFFEGDTWLFRQDDTLIRLFPTDFWFDAVTMIAALTVVELALVGLGAWWWGRKALGAD